MFGSSFRVQSFLAFQFFLCFGLLIELSLGAVISNTKLNSESLNNTTNSTKSTTRSPLKIRDKFISSFSRPSEVHNLSFYNYYNEYQFIVKTALSDGIIMVVQDLFMFTDRSKKSVSNGSCASFIQVTQGNTTFPKICGEVKVGDNSSTPLGLIGPRTQIFTGEQIIVNVRQHHLDLVRRNIRGQLVFTEFTRESSCYKHQSSYRSRKSCSIPTRRIWNQIQTFGSQICIASSLFCNEYYNCGNLSGDDSFGYDESSCSSLTQNPSRTRRSRNGRGRIPIRIPIVHQQPSYNPSNSFNKPSNTFSTFNKPSNTFSSYNNPSSTFNKPSNSFSSYNNPSSTLHKPSNTFSNYNYNSVPKHSPGYSSDSTETNTKSPSIGFEWLIIVGILAVLVGIGSLFGCKKESERTAEREPEPNVTNTVQIRRPETGQNEQELRTFSSRLYNVAPPNYEPNHNIPVDEAPPSYLESTRGEGGFRVPPPYKNC